MPLKYAIAKKGVPTQAGSIQLKTCFDAFYDTSEILLFDSREDASGYIETYVGQVQFFACPIYEIMNAYLVEGDEIFESDNAQVFPGHMFRSGLGQSFLTLKKELNLFLMIENESRFVRFRQQTMKNIMNFK